MPFEKTQAEAWMEEVLTLAVEAGRRDEVPVGALFVHEGKGIARGANRREETHRTVSHAEVEALEAYSRATAQWRLPIGTSLFVSAEPCLMCTGALLWARVENIYYGCEDPRDAGLLRIRPLINDGVYDHRFKEIEGGILGERSAELMRAYFRLKRKGDSPRSAR